MSMLHPDPTFYPSPKMAMQAPPERLAYVALLNDGKNGKHDRMGVIDLDPTSSAYGRMVGQVDFGRSDNELHHFGWNACSACLCPQTPHPHMERRYLIVPGIGLSRIYILDTKPNPQKPKIVKVIEPEEFITKKPVTPRPHTIHCGPDCIYGERTGRSASGDGPGGIFLMDANTFELKGQWEQDRGPQQLAYDFWWHLGHDTMITSEWGTPNMVKRRRQPGTAIRRQVRAQDSYLGPGQAAPPAGSGLGCGATVGARVETLLTIPIRLMVLSAWAFRSKIFRRRSGCGTARTAARTANGPSAK